MFQNNKQSEYKPEDIEIMILAFMKMLIEGLVLSREKSQGRFRRVNVEDMVEFEKLLNEKSQK